MNQNTINSVLKIMLVLNVLWQGILIYMGIRGLALLTQFPYFILDVIFGPISILFSIVFIVYLFKSNNLIWMNILFGYHTAYFLLYPQLYWSSKIWGTTESIVIMGQMVTYFFYIPIAIIYTLMWIKTYKNVNLTSK